MESDAYEKHKNRTAQRQRNQSYAAANIGQPPPVLDPQRREQCRLSLRMFCETYLSDMFSIAWSDDHLEVIKTLEQTVLQGGKYALAMPRGTGKSSLSLAASLWALLFGHRRFLVIVGATAELSKRLLESFKTAIETNPLISEDFPEVTHPVKALQGVGQRRSSQHIDGRRTRVQWGSGEVHFPDVADEPENLIYLACLLPRLQRL